MVRHGAADSSKVTAVRRARSTRAHAPSDQETPRNLKRSCDQTTRRSQLHSNRASHRRLFARPCDDSRESGRGGSNSRHSAWELECTLRKHRRKQGISEHPQQYSQRWPRVDRGRPFDNAPRLAASANVGSARNLFAGNRNHRLLRMSIQLPLGIAVWVRFTPMRVE